MSTVTEDYLEIIKNRIVEKFRPLRIILFGSHARGDASENSDYDLLIVFGKIEDKRKLRVEIRRLLADLPISKDIIVTTPDEIEDIGDMVGTILKPALSEGLVIYG